MVVAGGTRESRYLALSGDELPRRYMLSRLAPQAICGRPLGIQVPQQRAPPSRRTEKCQIDGGRRLADSAFDIHEGNDLLCTQSYWHNFGFATWSAEPIEGHMAMLYILRKPRPVRESTPIPNATDEWPDEGARCERPLCIRFALRERGVPNDAVGRGGPRRTRGRQLQKAAAEPRHRRYRSADQTFCRGCCGFGRQIRPAPGLSG